MTRYDDSFKGVKLVFDKDNLNDTLGEVISKVGKSQIRIAETEKYAHVTFFFSGGRETEFEGETRILINSPKVATYDLQPEMSAPEVANAILPKLEEGKTDFICLNFANGDMVGHTGIYEAIQKAVVTVDACVEKVVTAAQKSGYEILIIADHGNAEFACNDDGSMNTAHTTNPVPSILISNQYTSIQNGRLADVAPTVLKLMGIDIPSIMTGKPLV
jgi:2,3-bisphosphoglycerate-independent phosphoglycerate mutase